MTDREMPRDQPAESATLGGMMLSEHAIEEVSEILRGADFFEPRHEKIYTAILDLYSEGTGADQITVGALLEERGELASVGGPAYLSRLIEAVPTSANAGHYAEIVLAKSKRRALISLGTSIVQRGYVTDDTDIDEIIDGVQADAFALNRTGDDLPEDCQFDSVERVFDLFQNGVAPGVPTGLTNLDALLGGLKPGRFYVVAGRPGMGKSTLGLDFVRSTSIAHGLPSLVFSLEMGRDELTQRQLAAEACVSFYRMEHQSLTEDDWERLRAQYGRVGAAPIYVDDSTDSTIMSIRTKARRLHKRRALSLIVVDYLQLMNGASGRRGEDRQQEVSAMSRGLKLLAKELMVPIIGIAQLNRGPEQREDHRPRMSDLRESGSLEQDADVVILIHRESAYDPESPRAGEADLIVAKQRSGPTGEVAVGFQGHYCRFTNLGLG